MVNHLAPLFDPLECEGERERESEQGQPVQPFAHQWRASPPLNTAY